MSAIRYPVAKTAELALASPLGRAEREREAAVVAGGDVVFVTEETGPAFATREAALDAYAGRLEDERPGRPALAPEDHYCILREIVPLTRGRRRIAAPVEPSFKDGRRWPAPPATPPPTAFRLLISYWRIVAGDAVLEGEQARIARRKAEAAALDPEELRALARRPLRPVQPQQPLDIGLFESPAPEAPHILIPDD